MSAGRGNAHYDAERTMQWERAVLGCLLEAPELWKDANSLDADQFLLTDHRKIFGAIAFLNEHGCSADIVSVSNQLGETVEPGDLTALLDGVVPENFKSYVRHLRESARDRQFQQLHEQIAGASTVQDRLALLDLMRESLQRESEDQNWRGIFHTYQEFENAPPLRFAIDGFLQEAGVTLIGGLAGQGKTLLMLSMVRALLTELPLFGYEPFSVPRPAQRVLYLIPESSIGPFWSRLQLFRLQEHVRGDRLLVRTLSSREQVSLNDPRVLTAAAGADIFLDSVVRFTTGSENDAENARMFSDTLFRLLQAGARTITGCHHSPKSFETAEYMTLENVLRGSGDLGAMISTAWGVRQIDVVRNQLYLQNVKPRDLQPPAPFILEGRPHLDTSGQFKMLADPGEAEELHSYLRQKGGRHAVTDKDDKVSRAIELRNNGASLREISRTLGVSKSSVDRWLFDHDVSQKCPTAGQFRDNAEPDGETPN